MCSLLITELNWRCWKTANPSISLGAENCLTRCAYGDRDLLFRYWNAQCFHRVLWIPFRNFSICLDVIYMSGFENMDIQTTYLWFQHVVSRSLQSPIQYFLTSVFSLVRRKEGLFKDLNFELNPQPSKLSVNICHQRSLVQGTITLHHTYNLFEFVRPRFMSNKLAAWASFYLSRLLPTEI